MSPPRAPHRSARARLAALLVAAVALASAVLAWQWQARRNAEIRDVALKDLSSHMTQDIRDRLMRYDAGLRGLRGAVMAAGQQAVRRDQILAYIQSRDFDREFPGARGFGVVWRVPQAQEPAFVARMRREGLPAYRVQQFAPHDGERKLVAFAEPFARNEAGLGLDLASEPARNAAAEMAARSGDATLSAPVTLRIAASATTGGLMLALPIYQPQSPLTSPQAREAATLGWTYAALVVDEVLAGLPGQGLLYHVALFDLQDGGTGTPQRFYGATETAQADAAPLPAAEVEFDMHGRRWQARFTVTPAFVDGLHLSDPRGLALAIGSTGLLLALLAFYGVAARARDQQEALELARRAAIVEGSEDAIIGATMAGEITEWNAGAERLFGYTAAQALGATVEQLLLPEDRLADEAQFRATIASGQRVPPFDTLRRHRDGMLIAVSLTAAPILDARGRCVGMAKTVRDMREAQRARAELAALNASLEQQVARRTAEAERARQAAEEASRFLQEVTDRLPLRIAYLDREHRFLFVNAAQCEAYGMQREELLGTRPRVFEAGSPLGGLAPHFAAVLQGQPQIYESEFPFRNGGTADFEVRLVPNQREDGSVPGYYAVATDISVRKRAEEELRRTLTTLRAVLDSATQVSIMSVDLSGRISLFNRGAEQLTGYTAAEAMGRKAIDLLHDPAEVEARRAALQQQLGEPVGKNRLFTDAHQLGQSAEWHYLRKDGVPVPVSLAVTQILDDAGNLVGLLGIAHDVSARREIEQSLRVAMHRANKANQAKSEFLANMSHEIRTPMNAVIGLSYLLGHTALTPEQAGFVNKIKLASNSLLGIINDVLDLSKIEAAEMHVERAPFSLPTLLDELGALMAVQAQAKGIAFAVERPADLANGLEGDATRLRQVLTNLLSNAIKFTSQGEVRLTVSQDMPTDPAAPVALRFTVTDTGIGVPADALERIFQPFAQADASTTRRYGGTGLGLSIVRQLATLMGGHVEARSEPGVGSEFTVQLSLPRSGDAVLPPALRHGGPADKALAGLRLLVVDDSPLNLEVARRILELEGAIVTLAEDGQQAVDRLIEAPDGYDLVLMDMQMPVLDGHDATRRIRSGLGLTQLPIVALTAGVTVGEQQRAVAAGMNDLLGKPFEPEGLVGCILRHVGQAAHRPARPDKTSTQPPAPAWAAIDGLDIPDAQRRLGGDLALFRSLLRRMLQDFADLEAPSAPAASALPELARRLHKLKGTAGTLGGRALEQAAGEVEHACLNHTLSAVAPGLIALAEQLRRLRQGAAAFLAEPDEAAPADVGDTELAPAALAELITLLEGSDLAALQRLDALRPALRHRLPAEAYERLCRHVDDLDFGAALLLLTPLA